MPSNGCEGGTMRYLCWLVEFGHGANGPSLWSCAGACCCHAHMGRAHSFAGRAHAAAGGEKRDESTAGTPFSCVAAWAVHALCARRPCESRTMSENVSTADLSQRYGSPYAERGQQSSRSRSSQNLLARFSRTANAKPTPTRHSSLLQPSNRSHTRQQPAALHT